MVGDGRPYHSLPITVLVHLSLVEEISPSLPLFTNYPGLSAPFLPISVFGASLSRQPLLVSAFMTASYYCTPPRTTARHLYNRPFVRTTYVLTSSSLSCAPSLSPSLLPLPP
jgi:hypothetical protein